MKKQDVQKIKGMKIDELEKKIISLREEIAKEIIEAKVRNPKNTNSIGNKRRILAVMLTIKRQKRLDENKGE